MSTDYAEFYDTRLAEVYDAFCPLGEDSDFFLGEATNESPQTIIDLGCGTGILTVELAKIAKKVIGVEPAPAMLDVARQRSGGESVEWIQGYITDLKDVQADLVLMSSHVAQFFLDDNEWQAALSHIASLLKSGGRLIFDSRNPLYKPWEKWNKDKTERTVQTVHGAVTMWNELLAVNENRVTHTLHYRFDDGGEYSSNNELIYRTREQLTSQLHKAGFAIEQVYGDWDKNPANPASEELVFITRKV